MKKMLAFVLALLMVVPMAVACGNGTDDIQGTNPPEIGSSDTGSDLQPDETPEETKEDLGIPDNLDFGGKTVEIFHWEEYNPEFNVDEEDLNGDPINDAIYKKNLYTEEKLDIELNFTHTPGDGGNMKPFCDQLQNRIKDPTTPVDIVAAYGRTMGLAATTGLLQDLTVLDNLDLTKEWWPRYIFNELELDGRLFFTTGDISTNLLLMMYGVYYNRAYIDGYGLENPAALVDNDEWTVDKFIEMSVGVYDDRDATTGPSGGDFFGAVGSYWDLDAMYHAAGYKLVVKDDSGDGFIKWADELFTDVVGSYVAKMSKWVKKDDIAFETKSVHANAFNDGRAIFNINAASAGFALRDTEINYGVVPMPKLDPKTQDGYVTCLANPYSLYGICRTSIDPEMAAATMQVLGYYAMLYTTPAVFEVTLKGKWSKEEETLRMWDYMREGISFDLGRIYHTQLQSPADFVSVAMADGTEWSTLVSPSKFARRQGLMDKLNRDLAEIIG